MTAGLTASVPAAGTSAKLFTVKLELDSILEVMFALMSRFFGVVETSVVGGERDWSEFEGLTTRAFG